MPKKDSKIFERFTAKYLEWRLEMDKKSLSKSEYEEAKRSIDRFKRLAQIDDKRNLQCCE